MKNSRASLCLLSLFACLLTAVLPLRSQEPPKKPQETPAEQSVPTPPELPFVIQLLETHIRFEANGDSRKDVHTIVKLNNILGARQFARISFEYNRSFQQVEIPLVRISHANGGTSELLPSAVTDAPNPVVEPYPAYHDVRIKAVRILGLEEGDTLEYRVITTTTHHPLAPDFWLEHTFDNSGQVLQEQYDLDLPASSAVQLFLTPSTPQGTKEETGEGPSGRVAYRWNLVATKADEAGDAVEHNGPDLILTTYSSWEQLARRLGECLLPSEQQVRALAPKAKEIVAKGATADEWIHSVYDFVSQKIKTVDLPLGATGFQTRLPEEILAAGYGTSEDKFKLFAALSDNYAGPARAELVPAAKAQPANELPRPSVFTHLLTISGYPSINFLMDLNLEVAPYRMIPSQFQRVDGLLVGPAVREVWWKVLESPPFPAVQSVKVEASLNEEGALKMKVKYTLRGENELLLRVAFHQSPKEKWNEVARLLALSDGFRGQVTSANASDPMETKDPFTVEYEVTQPKFVDWASKKPVRIPALLPQISLPDAAAKAASGQSPSKIDLGTPLEVDTVLTLHLPPGIGVQTPPGTKVERDYATFASKYSATQNTLTASRHIQFLQREISGERAMDYSAFVHAVQNDQAQQFTLAPAEAARTEGTGPKK